MNDENRDLPNAPVVRRPAARPAWRDYFATRKGLVIVGYCWGSRSWRGS